MMFNFLYCLYLSEGGVPARMSEGGYALLNRGKLMRTLTEAEFNLFQAHEVRLMSGHWLAFYGLAVVLLWERMEAGVGR